MMIKSTPILVVGAVSDNPSIYTYAPSFSSSFKQLGYHNTKLFNLKQSFIPLVMNNNLNKLPGPLLQINTILLNKALITYVKKHNPEIIFFIKAHTIFPETLVELKKNNNPLLIHFYPDNPFVCWNGNSNQNVLQSLPTYDLFLIWSHMLIAPLLSAGCKQVYYFPFAFDDKLFNQAITITQHDRAIYESDVCFIGSWDKERSWWLEHLVQQLPRLNLALWGNGWLEHLPAQSQLKKYYRGPALYGIEMIKAFRLGSIALNFIRTQNMTSHNMRTCEIPASKSFMLTQRTPEQAKILFTEGENIVCFESLDELTQKIVEYLGHREERDRITENAYISVQDYTLEKQLNKLMHLL